MYYGGARRSPSDHRPAGRAAGARRRGCSPRWPSASGSCRSCSTRKFEEMAENNHQRTLALRAPRGVLYDRNGKVLVENRHSFTISIVREHTKDLDRTVQLLAAVAGLDRSERQADRRPPPRRADLPADRDRRGRVAGAGGRDHRAPARLRAARRRRRGSADAPVPDRRAGGASVRLRRRGQRRAGGGDDRAEERRHRRTVGHREDLQQRC